MKNLSESSVIQAYFAGDTVSKPSTQSEFRFVNITPSSNEYKTYIYDVKNYFRSSENQHLWDQNITLLRFDFMFRDAPGGGTETGEHVLVKYMAFFKTQADAEAFAANPALAGNSSQTTTAATTTTSPSTFDGAAVMATAMVLAFTAAVVVYRKKAVR